ncbi:unnamed protein product, partial [Nesidiocoris tenuis]
SALKFFSVASQASSTWRRPVNFAHVVTGPPISKLRRAGGVLRWRSGAVARGTAMLPSPKSA